MQSADTQEVLSGEVYRVPSVLCEYFIIVVVNGEKSQEDRYDFILRGLVAFWCHVACRISPWQDLNEILYCLHWSNLRRGCLDAPVIDEGNRDTPSWRLSLV